MKNNEFISKLTNVDIDEKTSTTENAVTIGTYANAYRVYLLERGYMTLPQLIAFDIDVCINNAKKTNVNSELSDEEWQEVADELYKKLVKEKDYIENGRYATLSKGKEE